ncbi:uncharacterized protein LMH87_007729 [Akanthomyces muscarius]|uniref:Uncharacterized protein n=1 Tax=Akanthomyces muscarius TaxID=2231603 RepID=A0A9W8QJE9_AKAMU|nr:uncharacterized protein LMH87_007729 [Akanthomyces muscarius]KAJ4159784.1 hypothetical protein LMH87_007729 [Akanthomyces muscarius]
MTFSNSFGIRCVGNAAFYASKNESAFLGCCTIDPDTTDDGRCPDDKMRPATFDPAAYSEIMAQECIGNDDTILWGRITGEAFIEAFHNDNNNNEDICAGVCGDKCDECDIDALRFGDCRERRQWPSKDPSSYCCWNRDWNCSRHHGRGSDDILVDAPQI